MNVEINCSLELAQVLLYLADRQNKTTVRYVQLFKEDFIDYDNYCSDIERTKKVFVYLDNFVEFLSEYEKSNLAFEEFYLKILNRIGGLK